MRDFGAVEARADEVESAWVKRVEMSDEVIPEVFFYYGSD